MNPNISNRVSRLQVSAPIGPSFGPSGVSVLDAVHTENFRMDWTVHPFQKTLFIADGSGYIEDGSVAWPIKKGTLVYVPDGWRYRVVDNPGDPVSLFILFFQPLFLNINWKIVCPSIVKS